MKNIRLAVTILALLMPVAFVGCTNLIKLEKDDILRENTVDRIRKDVLLNNRDRFLALGLVEQDTTPMTVSLEQIMQTPEGQTELQKHYSDTLTRCSEILAKFEQQADTVMWVRIVVATAGSAAGGIAIPALTASAPLANAAAINALGGVSGVTNAFLGGMGENGLTRGEILTTRERIRNEYRTAMDAYDAELAKNPPNYVGATLALAKAKRTCVSYGKSIKAVEDAEKK